MKIILVSEKNKILSDKKQAVTELAFCHYPVLIRLENEGGKPIEQNFGSFDSAREFVENAAEN